MGIREKLAAASVANGAGSRLALTDAEALELAAAVEPKNFPGQVAEALALIQAAGEQPSEVSAVLAWARRVETALAKFWDAYAGETVDGIEIVRKQ